MIALSFLARNSRLRAMERQTLIAEECFRWL
jgi:hypothetical protein